MDLTDRTDIPKARRGRRTRQSGTPYNSDSPLDLQTGSFERAKEKSLVKTFRVHRFLSFGLNMSSRACPMNVKPSTTSTMHAPGITIHK